jgi:hypothetical protein
LCGLPGGQPPPPPPDNLAARLDEVLGAGTLTDREAGDALGVNPNMLRYAAPTGTILIRWEGARAPIVWTVPAPDVDPRNARIELARRYLHVFGPTTAEAFGRWAGLRGRGGADAFEALAPSLIPVRTPIGPAWILASDEPSIRAGPGPAAPARLLPSGDTYYLLQGDDRELLVPDPRLRDELWTSRVWPGALLIDGEIVGTWRRSRGTVTITTWRQLTCTEQEETEAEAQTLPLPDVDRITVRWTS